MGIEEKLSWITGFVPVDSMAKFEEAAKAQKWAYGSSDPSDDDAVPTKLKNNKLVSLIYPLTDFLCFTLALIQLCVAHLKEMGQYIKDKAHRLKFLALFHG